MSLARLVEEAPPAAAPLLGLASPETVAVVDVGSNSVRLVQYRLEGRAIWTVFNEKVLAGLGRGVGATGRLDPEGAAAAFSAIRRFSAMLQDGGATAVFTAATAAVREAEDGPAFVGRVQAETGLRLRVLSGAEEARYAALGVLAGAPAADGVVGDLGGSSLELAPVSAGVVGEGASLPLGPFSLGAGAGFDADKVRREAVRRLDPIAKRFRTRTLHAVGGAWRNLALLHMRLNHYPLAMVHGFALSAREALDTARFVARQSRGSLERIEGVSKRRGETLPYAAVVLEAVIERLGVERLELSAYGVREGLIFEAFAPELQAQDPLIAGCESLALHHGIVQPLGPALEQWLRPAFEGLEPVLPRKRDGALIAAAARLADVGAKLHPDHRADLVFETVLRSPLAGVDHLERVFLATAAFARYTAAETPPDAALVQRLLSPERARRARAVGAALRLGAELSGRNPALLQQAKLKFDRRAATLTIAPACSALLAPEQVLKRLNTLAVVLERTPEQRVG